MLLTIFYLIMTTVNAGQADTMRRYYKIHAAIYDLTRWTFLLGRNALLRRLPIRKDRPQSLLEVGCGTGYNLKKLGDLYPGLQLGGVDVSPDMLAEAAKNTRRHAERTRLIQNAYGLQGFRPEQRPDVILFSYALTMFNPGWEDAVRAALDDLPPGGRIAVTDFHDSPFPWFKRWMGFNHVRMDSHLLPFLQRHFTTEHAAVHKAYAGWWTYMSFIGHKAPLG
jgi:S-adenosylmethionine-diacylgycerolhomoserine-N-methlytransferase